MCGSGIKERGRMEKLYIVIPAYNEEASIESVIRQWYPVVEKHNGNGESRLVIINDGSKDKTYEITKALQGRYPLLVPLTKENGGHGATVLFGYRYAIEHKADYIFQTDSDGQTNPAEFEAFWNQKDSYDAILGDRQAGRQDGAFRVFVENTVRFLLRIIFGVSVPDANAPFRLMKRELVEKYIDMLPKDFNLPNIMFTTYFVYYKEKVNFVKVSFKPRQAGTNSINVKRIVGIGWKALGDFWKLRKAMRR